MDIIGFGILICLAVVIVAFIAYSVLTKKIIEDQEQELELLRTDNERLSRALAGAKYVKHIKVSSEPLSAGYHKAIIEKEPDSVSFKEW